MQHRTLYIAIASNSWKRSACQEAGIYGAAPHMIYSDSKQFMETLKAMFSFLSGLPLTSHLPLSAQGGA